MPIENGELQQILRDHAEWLSSDGTRGARAELDGCDLRNADLKNADLRRASFARANLAGADLSGALLWGATLEGSDLTGAKLPPEVGKFEGLAQATELSKTASQTFAFLVFICLYSWVTIATTTDAKLLTNSVNSPLPVIQTPIPLFLFFIVAPFIVASLYLYLHLQLQGVWEEIAGLPAVFPDSRSLSNKVYPWLLAPLVRRFGRDHGGRSLSNFLEMAIAWLAAWCFGPVTLAMFWARYLPRHDAVGSYVQVGLLGLSVAVGIWSHQRVAEFLSHPARRSRSFVPAALGLAVIAAGAVLSYGAIGGINAHAERNSSAPRTSWLKTTVPSLLSQIGVRAFADMTNAAVSERPVSWTFAPGDRSVEEQTVADEIARKVVGAGLPGKQLQYANARHAFLVRADLSRSDLRGADLAYAYLQRASLDGAKLPLAYLMKSDFTKATLGGADLHEAYLGAAQLQGADLRHANLAGAILVEANLAGARLDSARLDGAMLYGADLQGATFDWASLHGTDLSTAKNLSMDQLKYARSDATTVLPRTVRPPSSGCGSAAGTPPELVDGVYTVTLKSDRKTCSSMMWPPGDVDGRTMLALDQAPPASAAFGPAVVGRFYTHTPIPAGAPGGTEIINIPPGDGRSGYFRWTFVAPRDFSTVRLAGRANVDDVGRVFVNGRPITPSIFASDAITQSEDTEFVVDKHPEFFRKGAVNTIELSDVNLGIGPSGAAFYAEITFWK